MKIVLWVGNEANQKALANKINAEYEVVGIVTETRVYKPKITLLTFLEKVVEKVFLSSIGSAWGGMKTYYDRSFHDYPETAILDAENINSQNVYDFTKELNPDLIVISGTRIVKEKLLSLQPSIGILNLHTGLSPYIKGGPNCTNWCISTEQFHLIGNTVMWVDLGIDTGNIVTTEFTDFTGDESLLEIHIKVMEHAHELCLKAIKHVANGKHANVQQDKVAKGLTYYTKQWRLKNKIDLVRNFKKIKSVVKSGEMDRKRRKVTIIKI